MRVLHFNRRRERQADRNALNLFIKQELNGSDTIEFTEPDVNVYQKYDYVAFEYHGKWYEYMIVKVEEDAYDGARIYGENSLCELKNAIVDTSIRANGEKKASYNQATIEKILEGTNWHLRRNAFPGTVTIEHEDFPSVYEVLSKCLSPGKRELETEIVANEQTFSHYLRIVKSVGTDDGVRLEYRGRLGSLKRITDDSEVYTAILPVGGVVEHTDSGIPIDPEEAKAQETAQQEEKKAAVEQDKAQAKVQYEADREGSESVYVVNSPITHPMTEPGRDDDRGDYYLGQELTIHTVEEKNRIRYGKVEDTGLWVDMRFVERKKKKPLTAYRTVQETSTRTEEEEKARREESKKALTIESRFGSRVIEDAEATEAYGINVDGKMIPRIGVYRSNTTNLDALYEEAMEVLEIYKHPKVTYQADVVESRLETLSLGDFVIVIDDELGVTLKERVIAQEIEPDIDRRRIEIGTLDRNESAMEKFAGHIVDRATLEASAKFEDDFSVLRTAVFDGEGVLVNYGEMEPQNPEEGDLWFRDNPDGSWSILVWDGEEWTTKIAQGFQEELTTQIDSVREQANQAVLASDAFEEEVDRRILAFSEEVVDELERTRLDLSNEVHSRITILNNLIDSRVTAEDMETRISQTEAGMQSIARAVVDGTNYMSKINQQAGHILFQVDQNRFYISPNNTYMDNGVIGTAQIQDAAITTAKIGEIDASKAIISNIDASNLTTGTIKGPNSSWNLKTGYFNLGNVLIWNASTQTLTIKNGAIKMTALESDAQTKLNSITEIKSGMASFVTKNELGQSGATLINGGNITTGTIRSRNGLSYLNLETNQFRFGGSNAYINYANGEVEIGNNNFWQSIDGNQVGYYVYFGTPRNSTSNQVGCVRATSDDNGYFEGVMFYSNQNLKLRLGVSGTDVNHPETCIVMKRNNSQGAWIEIQRDMYFTAGDLHMGGHSILSAKISDSSDLRLKTDVGDWDVVALDEIAKLDFIRFRFKDEEKYGKGIHYGISAQSAPWLSSEDGDGYLQIDLSQLLYLTGKGVQELTERVEKLEEEKEALEERLKRLEMKWEEAYGKNE